MKNKKFPHFSKGVAFKLSINISIILEAIRILGYAYNRKIDHEVVPILIETFISNVILLYLLYRFNFNILLRKWKKPSRFWFSFLGSFGLATVYSLFFYKLTIIIMSSLYLSSGMYMTATLIKDLIIVVIVLLSTFLLYSIYEHEQILLENDKLVAENIRTRYEVLKNQVDPHFLFNSLNTLDGLISMDTEQAHEYVHNLSAVFRYAISNKEITQLGDELDFTESYVSLMKIRYGESLQVSIRIADEYKSWFIMPVSLQLLVENAIKHNVISNKQPLTVNIETTSNNTVKIWNIIQPKNISESGEGIGLSNLAERYQLLFKKEIVISSAGTFCVELPLIKKLDADKLPPEMKAFSSFCS